MKVLTIGGKERNLIAKWYLDAPVLSVEKARFLLAVRAALDGVRHDFRVAEVVEESGLTQAELVLYHAYRMVKGEVSFEEIFEDTTDGQSLFRIVVSEKGLKCVKVKA